VVALSEPQPSSTPPCPQAKSTAVIDTFRRPTSADLLSENWRAHNLLVHGVPFERRDEDGELRHHLARLVDFDEPGNNEFPAVNQFTVMGDNATHRPDIVAFVNGIPLGIIEPKVPGKPSATLRGASTNSGPTPTRSLPRESAWGLLPQLAYPIQERC
jgi:type I restriction enzyme R subunit